MATSGRFMLADEIGADVHGRLAGQQDVVALVDQVGQAIDVRRQHRHGLVVVLRRQLEPGHFDDLLVVARRHGQRRVEVIGDARPFACGQGAAAS